MTIPVTANWLSRARSASTERKDLVRVYTGQASWWSFCSGSSPIFFADQKVLDDIYGITFHERQQKIYYTTIANRDQLRRCDPDGRNDELMGTVSGSPHIFTMRIDEGSDLLYAVDANASGKILKLNLDGTAHADSPLATSLTAPRGLDLDLYGDIQHVYWTDPTNGDLYRCELDGSNQTVVHSYTGIYAVSVDGENGHVYYTNTTGGIVRRVNTDGTSDTAIASGLTNGRGVWYHAPTARLYVSDYGADTLYRYELDGSNQENLGTYADIVCVYITSTGVFYTSQEYEGTRRRVLHHNTDRAYCSLRSVLSTPGRLDPITRRMTVSAFDLVFDDDGILRNLIKTSQILGKKVEALIGFDYMVPEEFAPLTVGIVEDWLVEPGTVTLRCQNLYTVLSRQPITVARSGRHPALLVRDIVEFALPVANVNRDSYDPQRNSDLTAIGHYNANMLLDWRADRTVHAPAPTLEVASELAQAFNAGLVFDEDGRVRLLRYSSSAGSDGTLTADDIVAGSIRVLSMVGNMRNQVDILYSWEGRTETPFHYGGTLPGGTPGGYTTTYSYEFPIRSLSLAPVDVNLGGSGGFARRYTHKDSAVQAAVAFPGTASAERTVQLTDKWLSSEIRTGGHPSDSAVAASGSISLECYAAGGATGTPEWTGSAVPSWAQTGASRPAYLLLYNRKAPWIHEIVKCDTAATVDTSTFMFGPSADNENGHGEYENYDIRPDSDALSSVYKVTYAIDTADRAQLGTSAPPSDIPGVAAGVIDITALVQTAADVLGRFYQGAPVIEVGCYFDAWQYQVGDFLTIDATDIEDATNLVVTEAIDSIDSTVWEIISKEIHPGGVRLILCYVKTSPSTTDAYETRLDQEGTADTWIHTATEEGDYIGNAVLRGFGVTDSGGLTVDVAAGLAKVGGSFTRKNGVSTHSLTASKDSYISWNAIDRFVGVREYTLGSGTPNVPEYREILLAKVVTGASTISSITDLRSTTFLDGSNIDAATVDTTQLASGAVTNAKIEDDAISADGIDASTPLDGNMIPNGTFAHYTSSKGKPDKWSARTGSFGAEITVQTGSGGLTGGVYLQMGDASTAAEVDSTSLTACEEGEPHIFEVNVQATGTNVQATAAIEWYDSSDSLVSTSYLLNAQAMAAGSTWYNFRDVFVAPSTARKFGILLKSGTNLTERVKWDYVSLKRSRIAFHAYRASGDGAQTITSGAARKLECPTEDHDDAAAYDASTNYRFTAPKAGRYQFGAGVLISAANDTDDWFMYLYVNGTKKKTLDSKVNNSGGAKDLMLVGTTELKLSAGDYVEIYLEGDSTESTGADEADVYFWGMQLI